MNAKFTYTFSNVYQLDAVIAAKVQSVDITPCVEEKQHCGDIDSVCADVTSIAAVGTITREITVVLTAEFATKHPTSDAQFAALSGLFHSRLQLGLPGGCTEVLEFDVACPPV